MLTDMVVEQEFEIKEEEPWYDKQDLEHDLQLAAELGKSLLERNRELEQGLQQMYSSNQEQLQEIEYLTKQVDLLRQVNDQHAKVYEQLDVSARELERSNLQLVLDSRAAQQKIQGLTETVEQLQTQVEEHQHQVETLKLDPARPPRRPRREKWPPRSARSVSCLTELQSPLGDDCDEPDGLGSPGASWHEEEQASLRQSLRRLQTQFAAERAQRERSEREAELLARDNAALEQQLARLEGCRVRAAELEREAEELRQLWKSDASTRSAGPDAVRGLLPNAMLLHSDEESEGDAAAPGAGPWLLERWDSERPMRPPGSLDGVHNHECSCVRRAGGVKYRGISLLNEVDAQYSALQVKYEELLRRCHLGQQQQREEEEEEEEEDEEEEDDEEEEGESVQTASGPAVTIKEDFHQPEYKELFREIFSRLQKTKEDLIENRAGASGGDGLPVEH